MAQAVGPQRINFGMFATNKPLQAVIKRISLACALSCRAHSYGASRMRRIQYGPQNVCVSPAVASDPCRSAKDAPSNVSHERTLDMTRPSHPLDFNTRDATPAKVLARSKKEASAGHGGGSGRSRLEEALEGIPEFIAG